MSRVSKCMREHHPCKLNAEEVYTYCRDNVDITITVQCDWVYHHNWQSCEVILAEPLRSRDGEFIWGAVLQAVSPRILPLARILSYLKSRNTVGSKALIPQFNITRNFGTNLCQELRYR
jgi:hypothetical protein